MTKDKIVTVKFTGPDGESYEVELDSASDKLSNARVTVRERTKRAGNAYSYVTDIPFHQLMSAMLQLKEELST